MSYLCNRAASMFPHRYIRDWLHQTMTQVYLYASCNSIRFLRFKFAMLDSRGIGVVDMPPNTMPQLSNIDLLITFCSFTESWPVLRQHCGVRCDILYRAKLLVPTGVPYLRKCYSLSDSAAEDGTRPATMLLYRGPLYRVHNPRLIVGQSFTLASASLSQFNIKGNSYHDAIRRSHLSDQHALRPALL
jgi:hypothetical protein